MKQTSGAAERNSGPILEALAPLLPARGRILEVASGPGVHVVAFAEARPDLDWQPSDPDPLARSSIVAWVANRGLTNVAQPLDLDVTRPGWTAQAALAGGPFEGLVTINLLHVAPWAACEGLLAGAARLLTPGAFLFIYGPFLHDNQYNSEGDRQLDRFLRAHFPDLGLRDLNDVTACAAEHGFALEEMVAMPANNRSLIFQLI